LEARDAFESQVAAMRCREALGYEADRPVRERLAAALEAQDVALSPRSRRLVGLNAYRRQMRDALDPDHRRGAWWFTSRADCDDLLDVLAGERTATQHVEQCDECQRDLARARRIELPRTRHLSEDDLWNYDLGVLSAGERVYADRHARTCPSCAQALAALVEGEQEIEGLTGMGGTEVRPVGLPPARRGGKEPEVLADDADFRLLVFRRRKKVIVVVQPRAPGLVAAAALELPGGSGLPGGRIDAKPCAEGLEIELSAPPRGRVAVRVRLGRGEGESEIVKSVEIAPRKS
jgi:hypothetical protein